MYCDIAILQYILWWGETYCDIHCDKGDILQYILRWEETYCNIYCVFRQYLQYLNNILLTNPDSKQTMPQLLFSHSIIWIVRRQKAIENVPVPSYHSSINTIMIASSHPRCSTQCMTAIGPIMVGIFLSLKKLNWERSSETAIHSSISYQNETIHISWWIHRKRRDIRERK